MEKNINNKEMIKINKISEKAGSPVLVGNSFELTCIDIATFVGKDGRLILDYKTGLTIEIPEGYTGLLFPLSSSANRSLMLTDSVSMFKPKTEPIEITAKFKINTDSVPVIYEPGEVFATMVILKDSDIELEISEYVAPEIETSAAAIDQEPVVISDNVTAEEVHNAPVV